jgi:hypothetical protein
MITSVNAVDVNETLDNENCLESTDNNYLEVNDNVEINADETAEKLDQSDSNSNRFVVKTNDEDIITDVEITIKMPKYATNNLTMDIDGVNFRNISSKDPNLDYGYFSFDLSNFTLGKHDVVFSYNDENYTFFKQATFKFNID